MYKEFTGLYEKSDKLRIIPMNSIRIAGASGIRERRSVRLRPGLIRKGMIYSPAHGDTAFTVPLFDQFLRRVMPSWPPRTD